MCIRDRLCFLASYVIVREISIKRIILLYWRWRLAVECFLQFVDQWATSVTIDCADAEARDIGRADRIEIGGQEVVDSPVSLFFGNQIQFVEHQPARPGGEFGAIFFELIDDGSGVMHRVSLRVGRCEICLLYTSRCV